MLLLLWPPSPADAADGMRCQGRLVDRGDSAAEVRAVCGEPDFTDRWEADEVPPNAVVPDVRIWVYNPGPGRLLSILRFRNGRLQSVGNDGYGFAVPGPRDCEPNRIVPGMSKYRLLETCGEPMQRDAIVLNRPLRHRPGGYFVTVRREKWLYNFGSSRLQREVTLENGVVTDVTTGERGFREDD
ncbi:hypothetical protein PC39_15819 [Salinisphaera sp. PC39]|uniref:DUF2845 domain-containing protein n=1 Tax=Salinisphaera sp. PC39 TaxID=1304156 RepID=UPI00333FEF2B